MSSLPDRSFDRPCSCGYVGSDMWMPAVNGAGERPWFVSRHNAKAPIAHTDWHKDETGKVIRYSRAGAERVAAQLNTQHPDPVKLLGNTRGFTVSANPDNSER